MRQPSQSSDLLVNIWFKWRWKKMFRTSGSVFCFIIVELHRRHDLDDAQRVVAQDRTCQFFAGDVALAQQALAIRPIVAGQLLGRVGMVLGHDEHPDAGALGIGVSRREAAKSHALPPPYVIKPIAQGSRVGVFIVTEDHPHPPQELPRHDWPYGERLLCERYIAGKELTCAVLGDNALGVIEIVPGVKFYDYEAKYAPGGSKHLLPAP